MSHAYGNLFDADGKRFALVKDGEVTINGVVVAEERDGKIFRDGKVIGALLDANHGDIRCDPALIASLKAPG